jgi:predicted nuclease of predicted toxin-antitoxin system
VKLLLDQNLSYRLCRPLAPHFEEVHQVRRLGMQESRDTDIWDFARRGGYAIVTRDADFAALLEQRRRPTKGHLSSTGKRADGIH